MDSRIYNKFTNKFINKSNNNNDKYLRTFNNFNSNLIYDYENILKKNLKKNIEDGSIKNNFSENLLGKTFLGP
jgi:hypothetical protein